MSAGWRRLYGLPWHSRGRGGVGAHPCRPRIDPLRCALPGAHSDQPPAGRALGGSGLRDTATPVPVVAEAARPCPSSPLSPRPVRSARRFPIHQPSGGFLAQWLRGGGRWCDPRLARPRRERPGSRPLLSWSPAAGLEPSRLLHQRREPPSSPGVRGAPRRMEQRLRPRQVPPQEDRVAPGP